MDMMLTWLGKPLIRLAVSQNAIWQDPRVWIESSSTPTFLPQASIGFFGHIRPGIPSLHPSPSNHDISLEAS